MDYDIRELQLEQLTILDELKRVCKQNNIKFYLAYGTCLGALRHQGFIPWDDDIDVLMYKEDIDKLVACSDQIGEDFFLQSYETDPGYLHTIYRLRKNNTACVEKDDMDMDCHHGIYIDIYPFYHYPDHKMQRLLACHDSLMYQLLLSGRPPVNHGKLVSAAGKIILSFYKNPKKKWKKIDRLKRRLVKYKRTERVADLYGMDISLRKVISYDAKWFGKPKFCEFEGRMMPVATDADAYMKERYGDDYMMMPPPEKRQSYHRYAYVNLKDTYKKL